MSFHKMIVKTQTTGSDGRERTSTEQVRHIPASEVENHRRAARESAPVGSTRTVKVVSER